MKISRMLLVCFFLITMSFAGCGGGSSSSSSSSSGGESTDDAAGSGEDGDQDSTIESNLAATWTDNSDLGALMASKDDGELLIAITQIDGIGKVAGITGAIWTDVDGSSIVVYIDEEGLPTHTVIGDYVLLFSNWDTNAQTVDLALIYIPTGYLEIQRNVEVDTEILDLVAQLQATAVAKMTCFPACESDAQNLAQLLGIAGTAIALGACGVAIPASAALAIAPCLGVVAGTVALASSTPEWVDNAEVTSDVLTGISALGCAAGNIQGCIEATLGVSSRMLGMVDQNLTNNSSVIDNGSFFLQNTGDEGVVDYGGGLPDCPNAYQCSPGSYMPCYPEGVKECNSDCQWSLCEASSEENSCGNGICEPDIGENSTTCPEDCEPHAFDGTWSGSYYESSSGDGGCTYTNEGSMDMTLTVDGSSFSGSSSVTGIELRYVGGANNCQYAWDENSSGSCSGNVTETGLSGSCTYPVAATGRSITFTWEATVTGSTMDGTFIGDDSGWFTLTK